MAKTLVKIGILTLLVVSISMMGILYIAASHSNLRIHVWHNCTEKINRMIRDMELVRLNATATQTRQFKLNEDAKPCPEYPNSLTGRVHMPTTSRTIPGNDIRDPEVEPGGQYAPKACEALYKVAIIIPHRRRENQLNILLSHMHPIWRRQEMDYQVYVINQVDGSLFNRGKIMNVGVAEATRDRQYDCYIFHDVDLLLEDDRCLYRCDPQNSHHLARYMDKFSYEKLVYPLESSFNGKDIQLNEIEYSGGVVMIPRALFKGINGFSNIYWGWGAEDDDLYVRIRNRNYTITNPYDKKCSYSMIQHEYELSNAANPAGTQLLRQAHARISVDGYNSLKYRVINRQAMHRYTNVTVDIGRPSKKLLKFMKSCESECDSVVPLD